LLQRVLEEQQPYGRLNSLTWSDCAGGQDDEKTALSAVVAVMMVHAPRLSMRSLSLVSGNRWPNPAALLALLEALPSLTAVTLSGATVGDAVNNAVLGYLAYNPALTAVCVGKRITQADVPKLLIAGNVTAPSVRASSDSNYSRGSITPFASLDSLSLCLAPGTLPLLAEALYPIATLDVTLFAGFAEALDIIATRLTQLHSLSIAFGSIDVPARVDAALRVSDVAGLGRLCGLRQLRLAAPPRLVPDDGFRQVRFDDYGDDIFNDAAFSSLVGGLPRLRVLDIDLAPSMLTWRSLSAVTPFRELETLALRGYFPLRQLKASCDLFAPLFPQLAQLRLRYVSSE
jgi:hypothetical protein